MFERPKDVIARNFQLSSGTAVVENKSGSLIEKWPEHQLTEKQEQVMKFKLGLFKYYITLCPKNYSIDQNLLFKVITTEQQFRTVLFVNFLEPYIFQREKNSLVFSP